MPNKFRFELSTLLVFVCFVIVMTLVVRRVTSPENPAAPARAAQGDTRARSDSVSVDWRPYSDAALNAHLLRGRTVLVNFGARWDLSSALVSRNHVMNAEVSAAIRKFDVMPLWADCTDRSAEVMAALRATGHYTIPVLAIYSPSDPHHPTVLSGNITKKQVITAIEEIGERGP